MRRTGARFWIEDEAGAEIVDFGRNEKAWAWFLNWARIEKRRFIGRSSEQFETGAP